MFNITANKGFQITFANGNTVSVQFGEGNYCDNRNLFNETKPCANAEFWAWDKDGKPFGEPIGWQTPDEIAALIAKYSA